MDKPQLGEVLPARTHTAHTHLDQSEDPLHGTSDHARLRHLRDGRPLHVPGLVKGTQPLEHRARSPLARILVGQAHRRGDLWYGPVMLEGSWRPVYLTAAALAHDPSCLSCRPQWTQARAALAADPTGTLYDLLPLELDGDVAVGDLAVRLEANRTHRTSFLARLAARAS